MNEPTNYTAPPPPPVSDGATGWQEIVAMMLRRRRIILTSLVVGIVVFTALAFTKAPTYTAKATLAVRPNVAYTPVSDEAKRAIVSTNTEYRALEPEINATVSVLESPSLIREAYEAGFIGGDSSSGGDAEGAEDGVVALVLKAFRKVTKYPGALYRGFHAVPAKDNVDKMVEKAEVALRVHPVEKSNRIAVTYTDESPQVAADMVNGLVKALMSPRSWIPQNQDSIEFFRNQRRLLAEKSAVAKGELRAFFEREGGDLPFENEKDIRSIWIDLRTRRASADTELAEATARLDALLAEVDQLPSSMAVAGRVEQSDAVRALKAEVSQLELRRSEMLAQYAPTSIVISHLDGQIERARALVAAEKKSAAVALGTSGPAAQSLSIAIITARARKSEVAARLAALEARVGKLTGSLDKLDRLASEHRRLKSRADAADDAYFTYLKKEEEARFSNALKAASIMNVELAEPAALPSGPDPTGKSLIVVLGAVMSLCVGLGIAVVRDRFDPALKSLAEVEVISGLPVVGSVWDDAQIEEGRMIAAKDQNSFGKLIGRAG